VARLSTSPVVSGNRLSPPRSLLAIYKEVTTGPPEGVDVGVGVGVLPPGVGVGAGVGVVAEGVTTSSVEKELSAPEVL
jgi:hypothetical protein